MSCDAEAVTTSTSILRGRIVHIRRPSRKVFSARGIGREGQHGGAGPRESVRMGEGGRP